MGLWLCALVVLGPLSLLASDIPRGWTWPLALLALAWAAFDANRYRLRPRLALLMPAGRGQAQCNGIAIDDLHVDWRGPLGFLSWRGADGSRQRASFWPDTLAPGQRRELRLALMRMQTAPNETSMAG